MVQLKLNSWLDSPAVESCYNQDLKMDLKSYPGKDCICIRLYWNLLQFEKKNKSADKQKRSERDYLIPNTEFKLCKESKSHEASGERRTLR